MTVSIAPIIAAVSARFSESFNLINNPFILDRLNAHGGGHDMRFFGPFF
jgi:hypothetical protein